MKHTRAIWLLISAYSLTYATADWEKVSGLLFGTPKKKTYRVSFHQNINKELSKLYSLKIEERPDWCVDFFPIQQSVVYCGIKALEEYLQENYHQACSLYDVTLQHDVHYLDIESGTWSALVQLPSNDYEHVLLHEATQRKIGKIVPVGD